MKKILFLILAIALSFNAFAKKIVVPVNIDFADNQQKIIANQNGKIYDATLSTDLSKIEGKLAEAQLIFACKVLGEQKVSPSFTFSVNGEEIGAVTLSNKQERKQNKRKIDLF